MHAPAPDTVPVPGPCQVEDAELSLTQLLSSHRGRLAAAAELTGLAAMTPFLYAEACSAAAYRAGFLDVWRLLDLATYGLQACTDRHKQCCKCQPGRLFARSSACVAII